MHRDFRLYIDDIIDAVEQIKIYIKGMDEADFSRDRKTQDAVIRNLEIIGEAAGCLPQDIQSSYPEVEWRKIKAMRNVLAHEYFGVNLTIVWDIIQNKLSTLESACRDIADRQ